MRPPRWAGRRLSSAHASLRMEVGKPIPEAMCLVCGVCMVLRRRRDRTAYFAGCPNFATSKSCKFTMELDKVLEVRQAVRAESGRRCKSFNFGRGLRLCQPWPSCRPDRSGAHRAQGARIHSDEPANAREFEACLYWYQFGPRTSSAPRRRRWRVGRVSRGPPGHSVYLVSPLEAMARGLLSMASTWLRLRPDSDKENLSLRQRPEHPRQAGGVAGADLCGQCPGQVYSAEVTAGNTPLLLSIPAMSGQDMVLHMKARRWRRPWT